MPMMRFFNCLFGLFSQSNIVCRSKGCPGTTKHQFNPVRLPIKVNCLFKNGL